MGHLAVGQRDLPVVIGTRRTLNCFLWIALQSLQDVLAEDTNRAGVGNYKSEREVRVKNNRRDL